MALRSKCSLIKDNVDAALTLISADMLEHDKEIPSEMDSVLKKNSAARSVNLSQDCLGIKIKHCENMPPAQ